MTTPFLLTGVTGGLGAKILHDMLHIHNIPASSIIATSRNEANRARFEAQGLQFRVLDYNRPETIREALVGVQLFLFMSSSERDTPKRNVEQANVVDACVEVGVAEVWYVSLAFGGFGDGSKVGFMQAHLGTERKLQQSGLKYLTLRAGVYTDAFPLMLNWYPSSKQVLLPKLDPPVSAGRIAFTSRDELGEGIATYLAKGAAAFPAIKATTHKNIVLLTSQDPVTLEEVVQAIGRGRKSTLPIKYLEPEAWIEESAKDDVGGKGRGWFEARLTVLQGFNQGDGETTDPALSILLGREPESGAVGVEKLVTEDPEFTWHQNHINRG